jgi:hypothetical protein
VSRSIVDAREITAENQETLRRAIEEFKANYTVKGEAA